MIENFISNIEIYLNSSIGLALVAAYIGGFLVSLTPCIYPVIPITVAYIGGQQASRLKSFVLSVFYVFGTAVTYTALGLIAALTGRMFGHIQSSPWTYIVIGNICLLMGLSMLEAFRLPLPAFMKSSGASRKKSLFGAFLIGLMSGLIMSPCTAPVLGVILSYVASKQNILMGMSLLFVFSLGMGTILILLGTFAGILKNLPTPGQWMVWVQKGFGWLFIILAEYFLLKGGSFIIF